MITLSYSSLKYLVEGSHEWLNKQMGIPVPEYDFLQEGKDGHEIIQKHVSGKEKDDRLKDIREEFEIVEEKKFDERCRFEFNLAKKYEIIAQASTEPLPKNPPKKKYQIIGFYDGRSKDYSKILEIKLSSNPWSMQKFVDSPQRKIYALAHEEIEEMFLITGSRDPEDWKDDSPSIYSLKASIKDRREAIEWIMKGIENLEAGNFDGKLNEDGICEGCFWNMHGKYAKLANCNFK